MKKLQKLMLLLAVFFVSLHPVKAQNLDVQIDKYFNACSGATSTLEMSNCLGKQYALVDAELKSVWKQVLEQIVKQPGLADSARGQWKHNFREAQTFWVRYKEAECRGSVPYKSGQGSKASVDSIACFLRADIVRLLELRDYLKK